MSEANTITPSSTMPPPEGCIDTLVLGHVLLIGINRPAKRNGWTPPMFRQLAEHGRCPAVALGRAVDADQQDVAEHQGVNAALGRGHGAGWCDGVCF